MRPRKVGTTTLCLGDTLVTMSLRTSPLLRAAPLAFAVAVAALLGGCHAPALSALMTDSQYRQVLDANFAPGMTLDEVQAKLTQLNISDRYRFVYPATATRPEVLLVRTYDPGGPWPQGGSGNGEIDWIDTSFVFGPDGRLTKSLIFDDSVTLGFDGQILYGPTRPPLSGTDPHAKWFATIPPPADPLQGAHE